MTIATSKITLDVRTVTPRDRHPLIFDTFSSLAPAETLHLIKDLDPKLLYYPFRAEYVGELGWKYLENGPDVWKAHTTRLATCCV